MSNNEIVVQLTNPERKFVKIYQDFLYCQLLNSEEKLIFIALKSFINFSKDSGEVFPTIETIQKITGMGKKRVINNIKKLCNKGVVKKIQRGLTKSNVYILSDYATIWTCDTVEEMAIVADNKGEKPLTAEDHIAELERMGYKVEIKKKVKEKEPVSDSDQTPDTSTYINNLNLDNHTTDKPESQERYPMPDLKDFFEYRVLVDRYPEKRKDIDIIFDLLYDTLNTQKQTIRVNGEYKERDVVIGKLMKLQFEDLIYAIDKYHEQTGRIKNVKAYLLTILYHAREQSHLDMMNLGHYNGDF